MVSDVLEHPTARDGVTAAGRVALATQGVLYLVVGLIALRIALGLGNQEADQRGAIDAVSNQPFGRALLLVLTVGLALHASWRAVRALRSQQDSHQRLGDAGRAAIYLGLTWAAAHQLVEQHSAGGGGGQKERDATRTVLDLPGGTALVVLAGIVVIGAGLWQWRQPITRKFLEKFKEEDLSEPGRRALSILGSVGFAARGVAFTMIGWFLLQAGLDQNPDRANGLDGALRELATTQPWRLVLVALGLMAFGVYRVADGALRRRGKLTAS